MTGELNDRMESAVEADGFSGNVLVVRDGEPLLSCSYGWANIELEVPNSPQTRFRIGSVTKTFTSMAVMILAERRQLTIDDKIEAHLSGLPPHWHGITLRQLMTHTSGIRHWWDFPGFVETMAVEATSRDIIQRLGEAPLLFEPGTGYSYSGVTYVTLALVVTALSGQSFEGFLQQEILGPAGMEETEADRPDILLPNRAAGYMRTDDGIVNAAPIFMPILRGSGDLCSTTADLARWDQALTAGKFVSAATYDDLYRPVLEDYGCGWRTTAYAGLRLHGHGGDVPGFVTYFLRCPERRLCVAVLANIKPPPVRELAEDLASIAIGIDPAP